MMRCDLMPLLTVVYDCGQFATYQEFYIFESVAKIVTRFIDCASQKAFGSFKLALNSKSEKLFS